MKCGVQLSVHLPGIFRSQFLGPWGLRPEYSGRNVTRVKPLYENVESNVRISGHISYFFNVSSGLKQGCLLSPLLFSLFINDMVRKVNALRKDVALGPYEQISILLYADDIGLTAESARRGRTFRCLVPGMGP